MMISTGSRALDALILGGVRRGMLYCVFGASGSGKTQLCMQLALNAVRMDGRARVFIIDAKGDFRPERMLEMDEAMAADGKGTGVDMGRDGIQRGDKHCRDAYHGTDHAMSIMDRVYVHRAYRVDDIFNSLLDMDGAYSRCDDLSVAVPLLIVEDSPLLFRLEYGSRSAEGHFRLMRLMHDLALRAVLRNTAVIVTNGVAGVKSEHLGAVANYAKNSPEGIEERQIMDRSVSMFVHFKVRLERLGRVMGEKEMEESSALFRATLLQPASSNAALFRIVKRGIVDII